MWERLKFGKPKAEEPKLELKPEKEKLLEYIHNEPSHLKEGIRPIRACIGTPEQFEHTDKQFFQKKREVEDILFEDTLLKGHRHNVDYYGACKDLTAKNFKCGGRDSYVISTVDNLDKFSKLFKNCTGIIVTGQEKKTGENISFLSHQGTYYKFLNSKHRKDIFKNALN